MADLTPYSTVRPLMGPLDTWLGAEDAERLQAYAVYEGIYRNVPEAFRLVQRGDEQNPIYIPSAKTIIEAKNRFLAKAWTYTVVPGAGTPADQEALRLFLASLWERERMKSKFATLKRWGLVRGDAVWHIVADEDKDEGKRISIYEVDPGSFFPIYDEFDPDKVTGVHLVDQVVGDDDKVVIKRQTYRKVDGRISYELSWWQMGAWDDRGDTELKPAEKIPEGEDNAPVEYDLDPRITALPVYHVKFNRTPGTPFGSSEISGLETLIAGVNQAISDEDLTLAMQGLGLYWTNSGPPVDEDDEETNWKFGPGWVLEIDQDATFGRVTGVSTVEPSLAHIAKLQSSMQEGAGVPSIALGSVDTQVAESGIALAFHMAPILSSNKETEDEILGVLDQMLYDLITMWCPVYESGFGEAVAKCSVGDPLPVNRKAALEEIILMLTNNLIDIPTAQAWISDKLGYTFPADLLNKIVAEKTQLAAATDPFAGRVTGELDEPTDEPPAA